MAGPPKTPVRVGRPRPAGLSWKAWATDLDEHLQRIEDLMWPSPFILGGGVSKNGDKFIPRLTAPRRSSRPCCATTPGIVGAAIVAAEGRRSEDGRAGARGGLAAAILNALRDLPTGV